mgnify:CR=1 FL=1
MPNATRPSPRPLLPHLLAVALLALLGLTLILAALTRDPASSASGTTASTAGIPEEPPRLAPPGNALAPISTPEIVQHTGDLPTMRELHSIRVLVSFNRTSYFLDSEGHQRGFEYELMQEYQKFLNRDLGRGEIPVLIRFIPLPFARLPESLLAGYGDVIAAQLTITPARAERLAFTEPYLQDVNEVVVGHVGGPAITTVEDLAGRELHVLAGSSYLGHLQSLNEDFHAAGHEPMVLTPVSEHLMEEDILEMVHAGILDLTVVDSHLAEAWARVLPDLVIHGDAPVHAGGAIAWAVRPDNPLLLDSLNAFIAEHKQGTLIGNVLFERYFEDTRWITNPLTGEARGRLDRLIDLFRHYGERYGFHWPAIAAQAYQESELDNDRRSPAGAVGIMQVRPATAADPNVAIDDIHELENNIHAGVKYLHWLQTAYFDDPAMAADARLNFAYAAYNAGPTRIKGLRERARQRGLDHRRWFSHVELVAREEIGRETVDYVRNIHKYYVAYSLLAEAEARKHQDRQRLSSDL